MLAWEEGLATRGGGGERQWRSKERKTGISSIFIYHGLKVKASVLLLMVELMISFAYIQASHLLKYDSMLGTFKADVKAVDNETISVDGKLIKVVSNRDPLKLPWAELGIDIVIEVYMCIYYLSLSLSPILSLSLLML